MTNPPAGVPLGEAERSRILLNARSASAAAPVGALLFGGGLRIFEFVCSPELCWVKSEIGSGFNLRIEQNTEQAKDGLVNFLCLYDRVFLISAFGRRVLSDAPDSALDGPEPRQ